ncbi:MAG TPA: hypothetical protein VIM16_14615 [Mucilaginibacter sp.]|jgi:hypothetical protein
MIKLIRKTTVLIFIICCTALTAKAQIGYDYSQYEGGVAVGFNQVYGDAQTQTTTQSIHFNFTFNATPFTNFVFEVQLGKLRGGDSLKTSTGRYFNNDFTSFIFRGQLQFGEFLDYSTSQFNNAVKNLYVSAGAGYVINRIGQINRYSIQTPGLYTGGVTRSNEPFIPLRIGYEFKIFNKYQQPSTKFDLGYEYNYVLSDNLDGFTTGHHQDVYTQFTVGVKFALGGAIISYRKQIHY